MSFYVLVPQIVMSYLSRYIFYCNKHVIKHLNQNRTDEYVIADVVVYGSFSCLFLSFTLFCTFSMSVSSLTGALFTLSQVTSGFIVIPCKRENGKRRFLWVNCKKHINQNIGLGRKQEVNTWRMTVKYTTMRVVQTIRFFSFIFFSSSITARPYATAPRRPP